MTLGILLKFKQQNKIMIFILFYFNYLNTLKDTEWYERTWDLSQRSSSLNH